jgi:hypothetical protein
MCRHHQAAFSTCFLILLNLDPLFVLGLDHFEVVTLLTIIRNNSILFFIRELILNLQSFSVEALELYLLLRNELTARVHKHFTLFLSLRMVGKIEVISYLMEESPASGVDSVREHESPHVVIKFSNKHYSHVESHIFEFNLYLFIFNSTFKFIEEIIGYLNNSRFSDTQIIYFLISILSELSDFFFFESFSLCSINISLRFNSFHHPWSFIHALNFFQAISNHDTLFGSVLFLFFTHLKLFVI